MKQWKDYEMTINGFDMTVRYNEDTVNHVFLPLLETLKKLQEEKDGRLIVFLAAPPAVGKSTLALFLEKLSKETPGLTEVQAVGLDGYHYHSEYLASHEGMVNGEMVLLKTVKGSPETYDVAHMAEKLEILKTADTKWPLYDRSIHDVREDIVDIYGKIVLVEGNYFLLDEEPWTSLRAYADYTISVSAREDQLKDRLIGRKAKGGTPLEEATAWYYHTDQPNVNRVIKNSIPGDLDLILADDGDYVKK